MNVVIIILSLVLLTTFIICMMSNDGQLSNWVYNDKCPKCATEEVHKRKRTRFYTKPTLFGKNPDGYDKLEVYDKCVDLMPCPINIIPNKISLNDSEQRVILFSIELAKKLYHDAEISKNEFDAIKKAFNNSVSKWNLKFNNLNVVPSVKVYFALIKQPSFNIKIVKDGYYKFSINYSAIEMDTELYIKIDDGDLELFKLEKTNDLGNYIMGYNKHKNLKTYKLNKGVHTVTFSLGLLENTKVKDLASSSLNKFTIEYDV